MVIPYFVLWKWNQNGYRSSFNSSHVNAVAWMMRKHDVPIERIVCVTDDPVGVKCRTFPLWSDHYHLKNISGPQLPSCYRRLKLFDPATIKDIGIQKGHWVVSFDLDAVILQDFLTLFQGKEKHEFIGWRVPGMRHRVVFNGSMWMHRAGEMGWVWETFNAEKSPVEAIRQGYMGSDQGYLSHQLVNMQSTGGWSAQEDGVLSYTRDVVKTRLLPKTGRVVFFPGRSKPWLATVQQQSTWIKRYWPEDEKVLQSFLGQEQEEIVAA